MFPIQNLVVILDFSANQNTNHAKNALLQIVTQFKADKLQLYLINDEISCVFDSYLEYFDFELVNFTKSEVKMENKAELIR